MGTEKLLRALYRHHVFLLEFVPSPKKSFRLARP